MYHLGIKFQGETSCLLPYAQTHVDPPLPAAASRRGFDWWLEEVDRGGRSSEVRANETRLASLECSSSDVK